MNGFYVFFIAILLGFAGGAFCQANYFTSSPMVHLTPKAVSFLKAYDEAKKTGNQLVIDTMKQKASEIVPITEAQPVKLEPSIDEAQPQGKPQAPEQTQ
jgi:hypothetical protein